MPSEFPKAPELVHPQKRPTFFSRLKENFKNRKENERQMALASGDTYIWGYVLAPFIIIAIDMFTSWLNNSNVLAWVALGFLLQDRKALKLRGFTPPHWGWALIGFPYIWKRCNLLKKSTLPAWISGTMFFITLAAILIPNSAFFPEFNEAAASKTTRLLAAPATPAPYRNGLCLEFSQHALVTNEVESATCTLDNGEKITVFIKELPNNYLEILWSPKLTFDEQVHLFTE